MDFHQASPIPITPAFVFDDRPAEEFRGLRDYVVTKGLGLLPSC
jgi:hypothetical protein